MVKVIINADDFGYSRGINFGIMDSHLQGVLTSTTLMANMPGFEHAVELKKAHPTLGVGVHMVLTCDRPLLSTHKHIVKENGAFYHVKDYQSGVAKMTPEAAEEVEREWTAQIEKVLAAGIQPTHLDSHHHTHLMAPETTAIAVKLARKYNLPLRVIETAVPEDIKHVSDFEPAFDEIGEGKMSKEEIEAYYKEVIARIKATDSIEIMTHPGYIDEINFTGSSLNIQRVYEVTALTNSTFVDAIKNDPEIELATYADL